MKIIRFFLFIILISFNQLPKTIGQNLEFRNDISILKDTLWKKQKIWKEANLYKNEGFYLREEEAMEIDFYCIPIVTYNNKVLEYDYRMDFRSILIKDKKRVAGLILHNGHIVGYLVGYQKNSKWRAAPVEIFSSHSRIKSAIDSITSNKDNNIYMVSPLEAICYSYCHNTFIFDNIYQKFVIIEGFIKERVTLEAMCDYYKKYLEEGPILK